MVLTAKCQQYERGTSQYNLTAYLNYNEQVTETYDQQGSKEAQNGRVENEDCGPQVLGFRPAHVAGVEPVLDI